MRRVLAALFSGVASFLIVFGLVGGLLLERMRDDVPTAWDPFAPLRLDDRATPVQAWKLARARRDPAICRAALADAGASAQAIDDLFESPTCGKRGAVALASLSQAAVDPLDTRCAVALALYQWERESVQPAAEQAFGVGVSELLHFGSYSCRRIAGSSRWSQHARANAIDISGFRLETGRTISLLRGWNSDDADERAFLRTVRAGACEQFRLVLSPDFNEAHRDHFHFDLGYWRGCR